MEQPEGFIVKGQEKKVYKLKKALYGLKQAAIAWNRSEEHTSESSHLARSRMPSSA